MTNEEADMEINEELLGKNIVESINKADKKAQSMPVIPVMDMTGVDNLWSNVMMKIKKQNSLLINVNPELEKNLELFWGYDNIERDDKRRS